MLFEALVRIGNMLQTQEEHQQYIQYLIADHIATWTSSEVTQVLIYL